MRKAYQYGYVVPNKSGTYFRMWWWPRGRASSRFAQEHILLRLPQPVPQYHRSQEHLPDTLTESDVEECHVAPEYGYRFRKEPAGFIPRVTSQVLKERIRIKDKMKETSDPGNARSWTSGKGC